MEHGDNVNSAENNSNVTDDGSVIEIVPNITIVDLDTYEFTGKSSQETSAGIESPIKEESLSWSPDGDTSANMVLEGSVPSTLDSRNSAPLLKTEKPAAEEEEGTNEDIKIKIRSANKTCTRKSGSDIKEAKIKKRRSSVADPYYQPVRRRLYLEEELLKIEKTEEDRTIIKEEIEDIEASGTSQDNLPIAENFLKKVDDLGENCDKSIEKCEDVDDSGNQLEDSNDVAHDEANAEITKQPGSSCLASSVKQYCTDIDAEVTRHVGSNGAEVQSSSDETLDQVSDVQNPLIRSESTSAAEGKNKQSSDDKRTVAVDVTANLEKADETKQKMTNENRELKADEPVDAKKTSESDAKPNIMERLSGIRAKTTKLRENLVKSDEKTSTKTNGKKISEIVSALPNKSTDTHSDKFDDDHKSTENISNTSRVRTSMSNGRSVDDKTCDDLIYGSSHDQKDEFFELDSIINELDDFEKKEMHCSTPKTAKKVSNEKARKSSVKDERHVWIYNINPSTTAGHLKIDLSKYGKVLVAKIVTNGEKYFGYALMEKPEYAKSCIDKLTSRTLDGYEVEVSCEPPHKKRESSKSGRAVPTKQPEKRTDHAKQSRKRDRSEDPLTLKVDAKKNRRRSRSSSRRRRMQQRMEEARLKHQRELEIKIENEKIKLEQEKRDFEKQKLEFVRWQKKLEEHSRARAEREKLMKNESRMRELQRQGCVKASSPARKNITWRRSKSHSPLRKVCKIVKVPSSSVVRARKRTASPRMRSKSNQQTRHEYRETKRSISPKRERRERRVERLAPPPPPRLTVEDLNRNKVSTWKNDSETKKPRVDYYRNKEEFSRKPDDYRESRAVHQPDYDRKRYRDGNYDRKYTEDFGDKYTRDEDKYKEIKKRGYDIKPPSLRSEVYPIPARTNLPYCGGPDGVRRFDTSSHPVQYGRNYDAPTPMPYHSESTQHASASVTHNWSNRPMYPTSVQPKPSFHQEQHPRYEEYDKRHPYYSQRKY